MTKDIRLEEDSLCDCSEMRIALGVAQFVNSSLQQDIG